MYIFIIIIIIVSDIIIFHYHFFKFGSNKSFALQVGFLFLPEVFYFIFLVGL